MSQCFTWDNSKDCTDFNKKSPSLLQECVACWLEGSSPWAREGQGVCCLQEMLMRAWKKTLSYSLWKVMDGKSHADG